MQFFFACLLTLGSGCYAYVNAAEAQDNFVLPAAGTKLETFTATESVVHHIEEDLFKHGNVLFSDGSSLKTTNGIATYLIAGKASMQGFNEGIGDVARFHLISGFLQGVSALKVLAVDSGNRCLRLIDRMTNETGPNMGRCRGMNPRLSHTVVPFISPSKVMYDIRNSQKVFIIDYKRIYLYEPLEVVTSQYVTTYTEIRGLTQNSATGDLYVLFKQHVTWVKYNDVNVNRRLAGTTSPSSTLNEGPFWQSGFGDLRDIVLINRGTQILVADFRNQRMRVLDLRVNMTTSFCGHVYQFCNNSIVPESLGVVNGTLYIGSNKSIKRIQDAASIPATKKDILNSKGTSAHTSIIHNTKTSAIPTQEMLTSGTKAAAAESIPAFQNDDVSEKGQSTTKEPLGTNDTIIIMSAMVSSTVVVISIVVGVVCYRKVSSNRSSRLPPPSVYDVIPQFAPESPENDRRTIAETDSDVYDEIADEPPSRTNDIEFSTFTTTKDLTTTESDVEDDEYLEPVQNQDPEYAEQVDHAGGEYSPLMEDMPSDHLYTKPWSEADDVETESSHSDGYFDPAEAEQEDIHEVEQTTADKHSWIRQAMYMKESTG